MSSARPSSSEQAAIAAAARAEALRVEGNALFCDGDYAAADARYCSSLQLDSNNAKTHCNRGMARKALGSFSQRLFVALCSFCCTFSCSPQFRSSDVKS